MWLATLHAGGEARVAGLTAAEEHGLRNWHRDQITVLVPYDNPVREHVPGVRFVRTRRALAGLTSTASTLPMLRLEPAVLLWSAEQHDPRTAQGVIAAAVQQHLTTPRELERWLSRLAPLRGASRLRTALADIVGGAGSVAEIDIRRVCKQCRLALPTRQVRRRDAHGRVRFTDCEWLLPDGRTLVLEIDGAFHMEAEHWEDDLARQRALTDPSRVVIRCTSRELRDDPDPLVADLRRLGVPRQS